MAIKFQQIDRDPQTGSATWEIREEHKGVYEIVGTIEKNTCWCGDGYRANSYSVSVERESWGESKERCFRVANIWNWEQGMTARQALAACKEFARKHLDNRTF